MNTDEKQGQASGIAAVVAAVALTVVLIAAVLVARAEAKPRAWHTSVASIFSVSEQGEMACRSYGGLVVAHKSLPCGTRIKFCYRRAHGSLRRVAQPQREAARTPGRSVLGEGAEGRAGGMLAMAGGRNQLWAWADSGSGRLERAQDDASTPGRVRASGGADPRWLGVGPSVRGARLREPGASGTRARHRELRADPQAPVPSGASDGGHRQAAGLPSVRGSAAARRVSLTRCAWARVGDRGPYSGNREFDLDTGLARAIGFSFRAGVGTVHWRLGGR